MINQHLHFPNPGKSAISLFFCLFIFLTLISGCSSTNQDGKSEGEQSERIYSIIPMPIPAALSTDKLVESTDTESKLATLTLDQILETLERPPYLPPLKQKEDDQESDKPTNIQPPLDAQHAYVAGRLAWLQRDVAEAKRQLRNARRLIPESPDVMRQLGSIYMKTLEPARGANLLSQAVQVDPSDIYSLYLLGRYAGDQRKYDLAITTLAHALTIPQDNYDPALPTIIQYLLGNALAQQGYDQAAIDHLTIFLDVPDRYGRTTRMIRELLVLSRERDSTWQTVGDSYHRLGKPIQALLAYEQAIKHARVIRKALIWRLMYSYMRVGMPSDAQRILLEDLNRRGADQESLQMVRYLITNGADRKFLAKTLHHHYHQGNDTSPVVMALAELLDPLDAETLLTNHLQQRPADRLVLQQLLHIQLAHEQGFAQSIRTVTSVIRAAPHLAKDYCKLLLDETNNSGLILETLQSFPYSEQNDHIVRYINATALMTTGQHDRAIEQLKIAVLAPNPLAVARIDLAKLLATQGKYELASNALDPLADSNITEVIQIRVRIMLQTGKRSDAIALLDQAIFQQPSNLDLVIEKANVYLANGDAKEAEKTMLEALSNQPRAEVLYEQLINLYQSGSISQPAKPYQQLVRQMMQMVPLSRVAQLERAKVLIASKRHEQAEPILRRLRSDDPKDFQTLGLLLQSLSMTEREDEANLLLDEALQHDADNQSLLSVALQHYRRTKDQTRTIHTAHHMASQLLTKTPLAIRTLNQLFQLLDAMDSSELVTRLLDQQLINNPNDQGLLLLAKNHWDRTGNQERSFQATESILQLSTPTPTSQIKLAMLYIDNNKPNQALTILDTLLDGNDIRADAIVGLISQTLSIPGSTVSADQWFADALNRHAQHNLPLKFGWALHADRSGNKQQAEKLMLEIIETHPNEPNACNWIGYTWANSGRNLDKAKQFIEIALQSEPNNAAYLDSMGWVLYKQGHFKESLGFLERASTAEGGDHPVIVDHLGDALYQLGQIDKALMIWRNARKTLESEEAQGNDPEITGLAEQLLAKITAVNFDQHPPIADAPMPAPNPEPAQPKSTTTQPNTSMIEPPEDSTNDHESSLDEINNETPFPEQTPSK